MGKLITIIFTAMPKEEILARLTKHPKTTALGAIVGSLVAAAYWLYDQGLVLLAGLAAGLASVLAVVGLMMATDATPKEQEPKDPPQ